MKIEFRRFDHVQLCVPPGRLADAREFYLRVLGLKEKPMPPSFVGIQGFWCEPEGVHRGVQLHVGVDVETKRTKAHPAIEIADVPGVRKYLEGLGVRTQNEPDIAGRVRFSFLDPFDNRIEFLEILPAV